MLTNIANAFVTLANGEILLCMLIGVVCGLVLGALPGLTGSMAICLLLPITYDMNPIASLVMLTAIFTSSIYGGSITAILLHTPGTPASGATAEDGFALTQKGLGLQAIGTSTISSMIGGFLSGVALLFVAPPLAKVALMFGPGEYFMVAIFGLTIISSLCNGGVVKGLFCAAFGLAISCIGVDTQTGFPRFMYGIPQLSSGLSVIPLLIGLYSMSQVMIMAENTHNADKGIVDQAISQLKGKMILPLKQWLGYSWSILRSTIIGILIGILPGAGGDIASYLAVNVGKNSSKHPEEYGNGSMEAIVCSESANNAVTGGALIPLLTLCIPGSATAAILLGGFTMHGLVPGNDLFTSQAHVVFPIILGFAISNIVMGIIGLLSCRFLAKLTVMPVNVLAPCIIAVSVLGSYACNRSMVDVWVMLIFGVIGYIMRKNDMITSPIVLAIILGPMAEKNLVRAMVVAKSTPIFIYLTTRPICILFWVLSIVSVLLPILRNRKA
ncbi:C4-dicarboxylate ABC transporter permease [Eubacteriales bacterium]|nr:tripartite tricarboxylate transporter permease [Faecalicatena sp. BF-R-105]GKH51899.1 C4-dicarboxylate ABC transporter permease [Eubacteriales bacterium]GKH64619.1 C4-dicarboxylate ABC transporter permease [Eubacteriales bacterium]